MLWIVVLYYTILAQFFDVVPLWDSLFYYLEFILKARDMPFDLLGYSGNHNGQAWMWLMAIPNHFFPDNYVVFQAWVGLFSASGIVAFYLIIEDLFRHKLPKIHRYLLTALYAFHPSILVNAVNITLDTGLMVFWLWYLVFLLKNKPLCATITGCCMAFTKEPGMVYLLVLYGFYILRLPRDQRLSIAKKKAYIPLTPLALMGIFLSYKHFIRHAGLFFSGFPYIQNDAFLYVLPSLSLINYFSMAFVLNFQWVITLVCGGLIAYAFRLPKEQRPWHSRKDEYYAFIWLVGGVTCMVLGIRHWTIVRYVVPIFPATLLVFAQLLPLLPSFRIRTILLCGLLALFAVQNVRSVDPVSQQAFCYTDFGKHRVYYIPPLEELCLFNPKPMRLMTTELVYNLEFIKLPKLMEKIMRELHPTDDTFFVADRWYSNDLLTSNLDRQHIWLTDDYHLTITNPAYKPRLEMIDMPKIWNSEKLFVDGLANTIYYIELFAHENTDYHHFFDKYFVQDSVATYDVDGYQATVYQMHKKAAP